jgi:hypothetical protein
MSDDEALRYEKQAEKQGERLVLSNRLAKEISA